MFHFRKSNRTYLTSDTHFHHNREFVYKDRGYATPDEHDTALIDKINEIVGPDDDLIHLGDYCLNSSVEDFENFISRIRCNNIYMLWGNHPNPQYKNVYLPMVQRILGNDFYDNSQIYPLRYKNVIFIGHYAEAIIGGQFTVLCHYPIYVWNEMMHGAWMLCGHSHYGCKMSQADAKCGKILDVGWDGFAKPLSFAEIKTIMDAKEFVSNDEHHQ